MILILDACTVINLLHIDEEDFLFKKINNLSYYVTKEVFSEITTNIFRKNKSINPDLRCEMERKIAYLRGKQYSDLDILTDETQIETLLNYKKRNGEFFSIRLAFSLSRTEQTKIFFITDDLPAKDYFQPFLGNHQIGYIEDSVDLLTFLFGTSEDFKINQYRNFLSTFASQYSLMFYEFLEKLRAFSGSITGAATRKYKGLKIELDRIISQMENFNTDSLYELIIRLKRHDNELLNKLISEYSTFIDYDFSSIHIVKKIKERINFLDKNEIYRCF